MEMKELRQAVEIVGGQSALAAMIGVGQGHIWNWLNRDHRVPAEMVIPIEKATGGKVLRYDLRPDIYPRETVTAA